MTETLVLERIIQVARTGVRGDAADGAARAVSCLLVKGKAEDGAKKDAKAAKDARRRQTTSRNKNS
jgi:hypothetical protein